MLYLGDTKGKEPSRDRFTEGGRWRYKGWQNGVPESVSGQRWKGGGGEGKTREADKALGGLKNLQSFLLFRESANTTGLKLLARSEVVPQPGLVAPQGRGHVLGSYS